MSTNPTTEFSKTIRLYLQNEENEPEPYPLNFYPGTNPKDIDLMIYETLNNFKLHSKNEKLRFWNRPDGSELVYREVFLHKLNSIVLAENQPVKMVSKPQSIQKKSTNLANQSTVNQTPADSQDPIIDTSSGSPLTKDKEKEKDTLNAKKLKTVLHTRKSSGPIVEKVIFSPTASPTHQKKQRTRSAAKSFLNSNKSSPQNQYMQKPGNEMSFLPRSESSKALVVSHERFDTSLTFNPNKFAGGIEQHGNSMVLQKSKREQLSSQHQVLLNESQSMYEEVKNEENSLGRVDLKSSKRNLLQVQPEASTRSLRKNSKAQYNTGDVAITPIDGNDKDIYSTKKGLVPFSYFMNAIENKYNQKLPPPLYLAYKTLIDKKPFNKAETFKGLEILPTGELKLVDPEILKQQKGIIGEVLQSLLKSLAEGRGIVGVSLPVRIFEPRSLLERICDWWTFIPNYIIPAAKSEDPIFRMKKVISAAIGGLYVSAKQLKPFNPLLGETYQAVFPQQNINVFIEHTSHHPPIANFLLTHMDFKFWGRYEFLAKLEGITRNTVIMHQNGPNHVDFNDGNRITFHWPHLQIDGLTHGDRVCKYIGHMKFVDEKNKIKAIIKFGETGEGKSSSKKRTDMFYGKIYRYRKGEESPSKKKNAKDDELNFGDLEELICNLKGSWLESLKANEQELWNIDKDTPTQYYPIEHPLPSDSRFREDLLWVKRDNKKHAHEWKLKLEERQRHEKKLRVDYNKKHKKH